MRILPLILCLGFPSAASADTLQLANGNVITGIVTAQTPTSLDFQFAWQGYITFHNSEISYIVKASTAADAALLEDWRERQVDFNEALQDDQDYDAQQEQQVQQSAQAWAEDTGGDEQDSDADDQGQEEEIAQPEDQDSSDETQAPPATADNVPQTTLISYVGPPPVPNKHYHQRHTHPEPRPDQPPFMGAAQVVQPITQPLIQPLSLLPSLAQQAPVSRPQSPPAWSNQPEPGHPDRGGRSGR